MGLKDIEARIPAGDAIKSLPLKEAKAQGLVQIFDASHAVH